MYGIRIEHDVVVFLQAISGIGLNDRVFFVLVIDGYLPEIRIPLVDIVDADELGLVPESELIRGIGAVQDLSGAQDAVIEIIAVFIFAVRDCRHELDALLILLRVHFEQDAFLAVRSVNDIFLGDQEEIPFCDRTVGNFQPRSLSREQLDVQIPVRTEYGHRIVKSQVHKVVAVVVALRGYTGPGDHLILQEPDLDIALFYKHIRFFFGCRADRHRPVDIGDDLAGRITCSDLSAVRQLVLFISGSVEVVCRKVLESDPLAVVDIVQDLTCFLRITGVDRSRTEIGYLAEDLSVRDLLRGTDGTALEIIDSRECSRRKCP